MPAAETVVHLKRRVRNDDTELFEWRKCACSITDDSQLVLETVDDDSDDADGDANGDRKDRGSDTHGNDATARVVIDLSWQLQSLEQKRKCKTRCELAFQRSSRGRDAGSPSVRREELMAPSPRHCEEWIELVREAEKRAKRRVSIRQGTATASAVAALSALAASTTSSSSSLASSSVATGHGRDAALVSANTTPFDASLSSVSASSLASSVVPLSSVRKTTPPTQQRSQQLLSQHNRYDDDDHDSDDHDELRSPIGGQPIAPLPRGPPTLTTRKVSSPHAVVRRPQDSPLTAETTYDADNSVDHSHTPSARRDQQRYEYDDLEEEEDEEDENEEDEDDVAVYAVEGRRRRPPPPQTQSQPPSRPPPERRPRSARSTTPLVVLSPSSSSLSGSHATTTRARRRVRAPPSPTLSRGSCSVSWPSRSRPSSATRLPRADHGMTAPPLSSRRRAVAPSALRTTGASSAAAVAASIERLRRREGRRDDDDDDDYVDTAASFNARTVTNRGGDSREELDILLRVETALRHLERENALAKEREAALAHQVASLHDALRVRSAEAKHLETHVQQLARDKEQWKRAAQQAELALAQLQDELAIAQEESQLEHSERYRLKHQNKELRSQVHRLDSIVYGRF